MGSEYKVNTPGRNQRKYILGSLPGTYEGNLSIFMDGKECLNLPVSLHVNTFKLIESNIQFYIYSSSPEQPETLLNDLLDQHCHGMNISMLDMPVTHDGELKTESLKLMLDAYRQVNYHDSTPEHNYVWQSQEQNSKVPTLRWEAVREGTKDYRYVATQLLDGNQSQVADEARKFLEDISSQIELRHIDYDPISGGRISAHPPGTYEAWRMRITDFIKALIAEKH